MRDQSAADCDPAVPTIDLRERPAERVSTLLVSVSGRVVTALLWAAGRGHAPIPCGQT